MKWAEWLQNPCHLGVPNASQQETKTEVAKKWPGNSKTWIFFFEVLKYTKGGGVLGSET